MAEVYAARMHGEAGFTKLVAVKRMLPHLMSDQKFVDMFLDEARLAANISSPHVAQTFDLGRTKDGSLYIVMELIVGVNLTHILVYLHERAELIPVPLGIEILAQAAQGLDDAHDARTPTGEPLRLVHRDISPQNIMVGLDGRARVTDFGIAHALHLRTTQTQAGEKKGKYSYFSPEQAFGDPVDRRTDLFALGVVSWELLLGRRLFPGTPLEALEAVRDKAITPPRELRKDIPKAVSDAIMKVLSRDPDGRFNSGAEYAMVLRRAAFEGEPATSKQVGDFVSTSGGEWLQQLRNAIASADTATPAPAPPPVDSGAKSEIWSGVSVHESDNAVMPPTRQEPVRVRSALESGQFPTFADDAEMEVSTARLSAEHIAQSAQHPRPSEVHDEETAVAPSREDLAYQNTDAAPSAPPTGESAPPPAAFVGAISGTGTTGPGMPAPGVTGVGSSGVGAVTPSLGDLFTPPPSSVGWRSNKVLLIVQGQLGRLGAQLTSEQVVGALGIAAAFFVLFFAITAGAASGGEPVAEVPGGQTLSEELTKPPLVPSPELGTGAPPTGAHPAKLPDLAADPTQEPSPRDTTASSENGAEKTIKKKRRRKKSVRRTKRTSRRAKKRTSSRRKKKSSRRKKKSALPGTNRWNE